MLGKINAPAGDIGNQAPLSQGGGTILALFKKG